MPELSSTLPGSHTARTRSPAPWVLLLAVVAIALVTHGLQKLLPSELWWSALRSPDLDDSRQVLLHYSFAPRLIISLLAGAALSLAGVIFQQVLRNPLAEPVTLGVSAGANLALSAATIWAPALLLHGLEWPALLGAGAASLVLFAIAWSRTLAPLSFILAGMVISLYCNALNAVLVLFNHDYLSDLLIWQTGSLNQSGWSGVTYLLPRIAVLAAAALLLVRPLSALSLEDENATSLGISLRGTRITALLIAIGLSAFVTSSVGILGFIGLAAPAIARLSGARRLRDRLLWAPLLGAVLLCVVDQCAREVSTVVGEVPAGMLTALFSVPLLLWLIGRQRKGGRILPAANGTARRQARPMWRVGGAFIVLLALLIPALLLSQDVNGWQWSHIDHAQSLLHWRWPRVFGALAAGAMLAVAGLLIQRLTGNPMASPEVLGASSGAALAVMLTILLVPNPQNALLPAAATGAALTLGLVLWSGWRSGFSPERMLLTGVCLTTLLASFSSLLLASGDPRMTMLLSWMTGSTYHVDGPNALVAGAIAVVMVGLCLLFSRPLDVLALGDIAAGSVGVSLKRSHLLILLGAAVLTAAATLLVGPLSFVGLIAPHIARQLGIRRAAPQLLLSAIAGGLIMVVADWLGRNLAYPWPISAGLLASLIGCPYFMWLMYRERR